MTLVCWFCLSESKRIFGKKAINELCSLTVGVVLRWVVFNGLRMAIKTRYLTTKTVIGVLNGLPLKQGQTLFLGKHFVFHVDTLSGVFCVGYNQIN